MARPTIGMPSHKRLQGIWQAQHRHWFAAPDKQSVEVQLLQTVYRRIRKNSKGIITLPLKESTKYNKVALTRFLVEPPYYI